MSETRRYAVETEFLLVDNVSKKLDQMGFAGRILNKTLGTAMLKTQGQLDAIAGKAMAVTAGLAGAAARMLGGQLVRAADGYIAFDDAITAAGAKFGDLDSTSTSFTESLNAMQEAALRVSGATKFTAQDAAGALDKMAMAGLTSGQSMGMLMGTANMAAAAGLDLTSAVDMATDAMGAFNLMKDEAGNPLDDAGIAGSMNRIADVVSKATNMANLDMGMWFETVKMGAPQFAALGGQIEEFSAMAGILANSGIKGSMAGTAINAIMSRLSTGAGEKSLKSLGVEVFDAGGKMRSFTDILGQFERACAGLSDEELSPMLKDIFGTEHLKSFQVLMSAGTGQLIEYTNTLKGAEGMAGKMAGTMNGSLKGQLTLIESALDTVRIKLGKAMSEAGGSEILGRIRSFIENLNVDGIVAAFSAAFEKVGQTVLGVIDYLKEARGLGESFSLGNLAEFIRGIDVRPLAEGIGRLIAGLGSMAAFAANHTELVLGFGKAFLWLKGVLAAGVGIEKVVKGFQFLHLAGAGLMGTINGVRNGITIASLSLRGMGEAAQIAGQYAGPLGSAFGTVFTGIGNAAGVVRGVMTTAFLAVKGALAGATAAAWGFIAPILANPITWIVLGIVAAVAALSFGIYELVKHWDEVSEAMGRACEWFRNICAAVEGGLSAAFTAASAWLSSFCGSVAEFLAGMWNSVSAWFGGMAAGAAEFLSGVWDSASSWFMGVASAFAGFLGGMWAGVTEWFMGVASASAEFLGGMWAGVTEWFAMVLSGAGEWLSQILSGAGEFFVNALAGLTGFFAEAWNSLAAWFMGVTTGFAEFLGGIWAGVTEWFATVLSGAGEFFVNALAGVTGFFALMFEKTAEFVGGAWEKVTGFFSTVYEGIMEFEGILRGLVQPIFDWITSLFGMLGTVWERVTAAFSADGIAGVFRMIGSSILSYVLGPVEKVLGVIAKIPGIGGTFAGLEAKVAEIRGGLDMKGLTGGQVLNAPPTRTAAMASSYSREENVSTSRLEVSLAENLRARSVGGFAPNITVQTGGR